jgi:hypothetical protein
MTPPDPICDVAGYHWSEGEHRLTSLSSLSSGHCPPHHPFYAELGRRRRNLYLQRAEEEEELPLHHRRRRRREASNKGKKVRRWCGCLGEVIATVSFLGLFD